MKAVGWWILAVVLVIGIPIGVWGFRVATADVKGTGDTVIKNNEVNNRTRAQETLYIKYNAIVAIDKNLDLLWEQALANPKDRIAQTTFMGNVQGCNDAVAEYNAETHKILSRDWRDPELPYEITGSDPATDCKTSGGKP